MKNLHRKETRFGDSKWLSSMLLGLAVVCTAGCEPDESDGEILAATLLLPTDAQLDLECPDAGIFNETCILDDPENPYRNTGITEFNNETGDPPNKFDLLGAIPPQRPTAAGGGAKSRFYLWATALAKRSNGENQWYTARALHELWTAQPAGSRDPILREQALRAYRSVLENYPGSVTFFDFVDPPVSIQLSKLAAFDMLCPTNVLNDLFLDPFNPTPAIPRVRQAGRSFVVEGLLAEWDFTYIPPEAYTVGKDIWEIQASPATPVLVTALAVGPGLFPNPDLPIIGTKPPFVCNYTEIVSPPTPTPPYDQYLPAVVAEAGDVIPNVFQ